MSPYIAYPLIAFAALPLLLAACGETTVQDLRRAADHRALSRIEYLYDFRTELCFAIYNSSSSSASNVPCTPDVMRLIPNPPRVSAP